LGSRANAGLTPGDGEGYTGGMRDRNLRLIFVVFAVVGLGVACRETVAPSPAPSPVSTAAALEPAEVGTLPLGEAPGFAPAPSVSTAQALVLAYDDFGPQVMAHPLVGMEWWQWEAHGDSDPATTYPVRVVVHRGLGAAELAARFPVDPVKKLDHRYVTVERALAWLGENIAELEKDAASAKDAEDRALANGLLRTLRGTRDRIRRHFGIEGGD